MSDRISWKVGTMNLGRRTGRAKGNEAMATSSGEVMNVFPFFVGRSRSGTSLMRWMFDSHPQLAIPPEGQFLVPMARKRAIYTSTEGFSVEQFLRDLYENKSFHWWRLDQKVVADAFSSPPISYSDAIRRLYALYASLKGKLCYGDKTPDNANQLLLLSELFPEARFVHIIRDGRDVALSQLEHGFMPTLPHCAFFWRRTVTKARTAGEILGPSRYLEVQYDALVSEPDSTLATVCDFLQLSFHNQMLHYFERLPESVPRHHQHVRMPPKRKLRDWRDEMDPGDVAIFEILAGKTLRDFGYELVCKTPGIKARLGALIGLVRIYVWRLLIKARQGLRKLTAMRRNRSLIHL
jgi:hypothetical protein